MVRRWTHIAERAAIVLVREGTKRVRSADLDLVLGPGNVGVLEAEVTYTIETRPSPGRHFSATTLLVSSGTLERLQQEGLGCGNSSASTSDPRVLAACERAVLALSDALLPLPLKEDAVRDALLWLGEQGIFFPASQPSFGDRLRNIIAAEPDFEWTMASVSRALAISKTTLGRQLRASGIRFQALLAEVRMRHALSLLQTTTLPMNQVALEAGYGTQQRFAARFRASFGIAPAEARRTETVPSAHMVDAAAPHGRCTVPG